jgi:hypothetical protein
MQRAKERDLSEGDRNTRYFMIKASGRKCKSNFFRLCQEEGLFEGDQNILDYATGFIRSFLDLLIFYPSLYLFLFRLT